MAYIHGIVDGLHSLDFIAKMIGRHRSKPAVLNGHGSVVQCLCVHRVDGVADFAATLCLILYELGNVQREGGQQPLVLRLRDEAAIFVKGDHVRINAVVMTDPLRRRCHPYLLGAFAHFPPRAWRHNPDP